MSSSSAILNFLQGFGIDPQNAGEVYGFSDDEEYVDNYSGWYHVVGTMREGKIEGKNYDGLNAFVPDANSVYKVWFVDDPHKMGWIEKGFPDPILEISFDAVLPTPPNE